MLKIKSNTNKFTIIFLRRLERKRMLKRSRSAFVQFSTPFFFFFFFFFPISVFFCFSTPFVFCSMPLFFFLYSAPVSLFFRRVALYFSTQYTFFSAQNVFASAQNLFQSKTFFSPKISPCLWFSPKPFSVQNIFQPKNLSLFVVQCLLLFVLFSASFLSFNVLPFSPSLVQPSIFKAKKKSSFGSVYPRPSILSSCFTSLLFE